MRPQTDLLMTHAGQMLPYCDFKTQHGGWTVYLSVFKTKKPLPEGFNGFLVIAYTGVDERGIHLGIQTLDVVVRRGRGQVRRVLWIRSQDARLVERCVEQARAELGVLTPDDPVPSPLLN